MSNFTEDEIGEALGLRGWGSPEIEEILQLTDRVQKLKRPNQKIVIARELRPVDIGQQITTLDKGWSGILTDVVIMNDEALASRGWMRSDPGGMLIAIDQKIHLLPWRELVMLDSEPAI